MPKDLCDVDEREEEPKRGQVLLEQIGVCDDGQGEATTQDHLLEHHNDCAHHCSHRASTVDTRPTEVLEGNTVRTGHSRARLLRKPGAHQAERRRTGPEQLVGHAQVTKVIVGDQEPLQPRKLGERIHGSAHQLVVR